MTSWGPNYHIWCAAHTNGNIATWTYHGNITCAIVDIGHRCYHPRQERTIAQNIITGNITSHAYYATGETGGIHYASKYAIVGSDIAGGTEHGCHYVGTVNIASCGYVTTNYIAAGWHKTIGQKITNCGISSNTQCGQCTNIGCIYTGQLATITYNIGAGDVTSHTYLTASEAGCVHYVGELAIVGSNITAHAEELIAGNDYYRASIVFVK